MNRFVYGPGGIVMFDCVWSAEKPLPGVNQSRKYLRTFLCLFSSFPPNTWKKRSLFAGNSNYLLKLEKGLSSIKQIKNKSTDKQVYFDSLKGVLRTHTSFNVRPLFIYNLFIIYLFIYPFTYFHLTARSINCDWNFFLSGREHNFMKFGNSLIDSLGTPYDYRSVMHYSQNAFSKNGLPTILVKQEGVCVRYIIRLFTYH